VCDPQNVYKKRLILYLMKVILYMAVSANGYIAGENDNVEWVSEDSWNSYLKKVKEIGCVIIGRKTYDLMPNDEFVEGVRYIVLTRSAEILSKKTSNIEFSNKEPGELLESLQKEGIKEVCICGGGEINTAFMKESLIDEMYLDVEPIVLGKGIQLFVGDFEANVELIDMKKLSPNEVQLHYRVKK